MVELRYGDYYEIAELAGKSVAEVREQYKPTLNIPDKTKTRLNDRNIKKNQESETWLKDDDTLRFVDKSRKSPFFILAALVALAATAVPFAFAQTTASLDLNVVEKDDFVTVSANSTVPTWKVFGKFKGATGSGALFKVTPSSGFTGDLSCMVMVGNGEELVKCYRVLIMKLSIYGSDGSGDCDTSANLTAYSEFLTLSKGEVDFTLENLGSAIPPYWVYLDSGFYISHYWGATTMSGDEDPLLYCDVTQKGT